MWPKITLLNFFSPNLLNPPFYPSDLTIPPSSLYHISYPTSYNSYHPYYCHNQTQNHYLHPTTHQQFKTSPKRLQLPNAIHCPRLYGNMIVDYIMVMRINSIWSERLSVVQMALTYIVNNSPSSLPTVTQTRICL